MKNKIWIGIILAGMVLFINSCENKEAIVPLVSLPTGCDTTKLSYNSTSDSVSGIINTQCAVSGCHVPHSSSAAPDFTSYTKLMTDAQGGKSSLFYSCLYNSYPYAMPNVPQPGWNDACNQAKLKQWILDGAPQ